MSENETVIDWERIGMAKAGPDRWERGSGRQHVVAWLDVSTWTVNIGGPSSKPHWIGMTEEQAFALCEALVEFAAG